MLEVKLEAKDGLCFLTRQYSVDIQGVIMRTDVVAVDDIQNSSPANYYRDPEKGFLCLAPLPRLETPEQTIAELVDSLRGTVEMPFSLGFLKILEKVDSTTSIRLGKATIDFLKDGIPVGKVFFSSPEVFVGTFGELLVKDRLLVTETGMLGKRSRELFKIRLLNIVAVNKPCFSSIEMDSDFKSYLLANAHLLDSVGDECPKTIEEQINKKMIIIYFCLFRLLTGYEEVTANNGHNNQFGGF